LHNFRFKLLFKEFFDNSMKVLMFVFVLFLGPNLILAGDVKPKIALKLERTVGYKNGDVVIAHIVVSGVPDGFVLDGKSFPRIGSKLNSFAEFAGWRKDGQEIILRVQIFRLVDGVWSVRVPFPKLVFKKKGETFNVSLRSATILMGPLSSSKLIQFLPSLLPPVIDIAREDGPFALMWLGIVTAIFAVLIFVCGFVEKRKSSAAHPYVAALLALKKLKKKELSEEEKINKSFEIFQAALEKRFGRVIFSDDPDIKYFGQSGQALLKLSDEYLYHENKPELGAEMVIEAMTEFFTKMFWEES